MLKLNIQLFADGKVVIETDLDSKGFKDGLSKMQSIAKTGFKAVGTAIGIASSAIVGLLGYGVKFNSEIEQLETSFEVMTGSADKAREVIQKLKDVGAKTPYDLKGLAQTTQTLMQYGMNADEAYNATLNLGDIAQGSAEKMQGIALAYGQMSSAGKVNMQDIKQMINQGFNPLQAIADMTGESMQQVTKRYEEGKVSVNEVTKAMQYASSQGGKYYQSMEKQSKTLAGQVSTLKDNFSSLAGTLSGSVTQSISGGVLPAINDLLQGLEQAFTEDGIEGFADKLGEGVATLITKLTESAPQLIEVATIMIQSLLNGIQENMPLIAQSAVSIITQFITSIFNLLPEFLQTGITMIVELIKGITQSLPELIPVAIDSVLTIVDTLLDNIDMIIDCGIELLLALVDGLMNAIPKLIEKAPTIIIKLISALIKQLPKILALGPKLIIELAKGVVNGIPELIKKAPKIISSIVNELKKGVKDFLTVGGDLVKGLWNGIKDAEQWVIDKIKGFGKSILNGIKSFFGIKSPSRVFKEQVGKNLALGVGEGFEDALDNVYDKMQKAIDIETSKMSANVQSNGTYQVAMQGLPTFNLLDNTSNTTQLVCNGKVLAEVVNTENRNREVARA